jgi:hypothetical protein
MKALLHPTCFPSIAQFIVMLKAEIVYFEVCDNYQKQTYRNRAFIYGANGKLQLNIPVEYTQKNRQLYKDVTVFHNTKWQLLHLKSLQSAYRTSPFFEFYIDELQPLFEIKANHLLDYNLKCIKVLMECLQIEFNYETTQQFEKIVTDKTDFRYLTNSRKEKPQHFDTYTQVFSDKHGFISNLSILDLLFNEGPNAVSYLESQKLK